MLFDLTFPCYLTTFSGKKCLSGKVLCVFFCPAYRSSPVYEDQSFLSSLPLSPTCQSNQLSLAAKKKKRARSFVSPIFRLWKQFGCDSEGVSLQGRQTGPTIQRRFTPGKPSFGYSFLPVAQPKLQFLERHGSRAKGTLETFYHPHPRASKTRRC
jgi:hypothetical protein